MRTNTILTNPIGAVGLTSLVPARARSAFVPAASERKLAKSGTESLAMMAQAVIRQERMETVAWLAVAIAALAVLVLSLSLGV